MFKFGDNTYRGLIGEFDIYVLIKMAVQLITTLLIIMSGGVKSFFIFLSKRKIFINLLIYSLISILAIFVTSGSINGYYFSFSVIYSLLLISWLLNVEKPDSSWFEFIFNRIYYIVIISLLASFIFFPELTYGPKTQFRLQSITLYVGSNGLAWFLTCFSIFLYFKKQKNKKIILVLILALIIITKSRTSIAIISLFYFLVLNNKLKYLFLFLIIGSFDYSYFFEIVSRNETQFSNLSGRTLIWDLAIQKLQKNQLIGHGLWNGPFEALFETQFTGISQLHNSFVEVLVSTGLIGLFFWSLFLILNVFKSFKNLIKIWRYKSYLSSQYLFCNIFFLILPIKMLTSSEAIYFDHSMILFLLTSNEIFKNPKFIFNR